MAKLYVVGLGPGSPDGMTLRAREVLQTSEVVTGYAAYVELVRPLFPDKSFLTTGMRQELERVKTALELASQGRTVALVCSGDAGVYGMSGPALELAAGFPGVEIEVVPGVTAALSGAALLGAPLMHDFAVISLSDLLTPWEVIERRLRGAAAADFVLCLYNPASRNRPEHLKRACDVLLDYVNQDRPCGIVRSVGREGEELRVLTLAELREAEVDMFCTVFVGNSQTKVIGGRLVTPRGYAHES